MGDEYKPKLKEWRLCFRSADGYNNRKEVAGAIGGFYADRFVDVCPVEAIGKVILDGKIFGCDGVVDGTQHTTNYLKSLERVRGVPEGVELFCATIIANNGNEARYYLDADDCAPMTLMLLNDASKDNLKEFPNFYIDQDLWGKGFI